MISEPDPKAVRGPRFPAIGVRISPGAPRRSLIQLLPHFEVMWPPRGPPNACVQTLVLLAPNKHRQGRDRSD